MECPIFHNSQLKELTTLGSLTIKQKPPRYIGHLRSLLAGHLTDSIIPHLTSFWRIAIAMASARLVTAILERMLLTCAFTVERLT